MVMLVILKPVDFLPPSQVFGGAGSGRGDRGL